MLATAVAGGYFSYGLFSVSRNAQSYVAVRIPVDLAKTGSNRGRFRPRYTRVHGHQFRLEVEPAFGSRESAKSALDGVRGKLQILNKTGKPILNEVFDSANFEFGDMEGDCGHAELPPDTPYLYFQEYFAGGDEYDLVLDVDAPAFGMHNRRQTIIAKNVYCLTTTGMSRLFGWGALILAGIAGLGGAWMVRSVLSSPVRGGVESRAVQGGI